MKYRRILLKLSGEALLGSGQYGIDPVRLSEYASEIKSASAMGVEIAIVIGGGNIFRGLQGVASGFDRVQGDYMGMLATLINSIALQSALNAIGVKSELLSGLPVQPIAQPMSREKAINSLEHGNVVIIAGGTGNPFFTTDTASALRAVEIKADAILKGTRVDGIYTSDPEKDKNAVRYTTITYDEVYAKGLNIMDLTAITLCRENKLPIIVFDMNLRGNLVKLLNGEDTGTLVTV